MKTCVLFDHDGVLVDTEGWYFRAGAEVLAGVGVTLDQERYLDDMARGAGTWEQAREAGVDKPTIDRLREDRDRLYRHHLSTQPIEIEGVLEVLGALAGRVRMAVVTTARRADVELIHADRSILGFMEFVLAREDYTHAKPDPEPYLTGLHRLGVAAAEVLVVEDSARGLASAVAAGLDCVVVDHPFTRTQDLSAARHRIGSLRELPAVLAVS